MHTNNYVPTIVQKGARRAARLWKRDRSISLAVDKKFVHRAYRHRMKIRVDNITKGFADWDDYDDHAPSSCTLTAWDVW